MEERVPQRPRFLFPMEATVGHVVLVSYPRSGNTLLRSLLEQYTGIVTGSDTKPSRTLSKQLNEVGLQGEGVVDSRAWIVKTHFPERRGWRKFGAQKVILLVRSPFDAIDSFFNMALTRTHTQSIVESEYQRLDAAWQSFVDAEITMWSKFHYYWLQLASPNPYFPKHTLAVRAPLYVVRYEDLINDVEATMYSVLQFLYGEQQSPLEASSNGIPRCFDRFHVNAWVSPPRLAPEENEEGYDDDDEDDCEKAGDRYTGEVEVKPVENGAVVGETVRNAGAYKPRSGRVHASLRHYSDAQLDKIFSQLQRELKYFKYDAEFYSSAIGGEGVSPFLEGFLRRLDGDSNITAAGEEERRMEGAEAEGENGIAGCPHEGEKEKEKEKEKEETPVVAGGGGESEVECSFSRHNGGWHRYAERSRKKVVNVKMNYGTVQLRKKTPDDPYGRGIAWSKHLCATQPVQIAEKKYT